MAAKVGYDINYHVTGSIRLAHTRDRVDEFKHVVSQAHAQGIEFAMLSPAEIRERHPFVTTGDILAGLYDPYDGDIDPAQLTQALAKGARDGGAQIYRNTKVTGIQRLPSGEWRVETSKGAITCEKVINAAGYRGGEVAAMVGEYLPIVTLSHQYLITEDIPALVERGAARLPLLRDPDVSYYMRQERQGLILGPYEWKATAHWLDRIPDEFANQLFDDDLGRLEKYIEAACERVPILGTAGIRKVINGPIPYAPDGNPLIGPAPGLPGFYHACAFTFGIAQAGGAGKIIAEWVAHGQPEWDVWPLDSRRYLDFANDKFVLAKAIETYQHEYGIGYPAEERPAGRPAKMFARVPAAGRQGCEVRRARRLGTRGVFPAAGRPEGTRGFVPSSGVACGDRARMRGRARARRDPRPAGVHEVRGHGSWRTGLARSHGGGRCAEARTHRAQLFPQRQGRHRHRDDADQSRRGPLLADQRGGRRASRRALAARAPAVRRFGADREPVGAVRVADRRRTEITRVARGADAHRPLERGLPVAHRSHDRHRLHPRHRAARELRRRTGLGTARPDRAPAVDRTT